MKKVDELTELEKEIRKGRIRSIVVLIIVMLVFSILMFIKDRDNMKNLLILFAMVGPISLVIGFSIQKLFMNYK